MESKSVNSFIDFSPAVVGSHSIYCSEDDESKEEHHDAIDGSDRRCEKSNTVSHDQKSLPLSSTLVFLYSLPCIFSFPPLFPPPSYFSLFFFCFLVFHMRINCNSRRNI